MNTLSFLQNHYDFTICFSILLWIYYLLHVPLWIQYLFREIIMKSLSASRFHFEFTIPSPESLCFLFREITICFAISSRIKFLPRNNYEFTLFFAISLWFHYLLRDFAMNTAKSLWFHYLLPEITMNTLFFTKSIWIHSLLGVSL